MAFNTSSCITSFNSPKARVKISDTKICPHCNAAKLIKNGFTAIRCKVSNCCFMTVLAIKSILLATIIYFIYCVQYFI